MHKLPGFHSQVQRQFFYLTTWILLKKNTNQVHFFGTFTPVHILFHLFLSLFIFLPTFFSDSVSSYKFYAPIIAAARRTRYELSLTIFFFLYLTYTHTLALLLASSLLASCPIFFSFFAQSKNTRRYMTLVLTKQVEQPIKSMRIYGFWKSMKL